jgi:hypothetical protein
MLVCVDWMQLTKDLDQLRSLVTMAKNYLLA